ncbi:hypothetical protein BT63DRAFT_273163 [Microthyrium microscopicum]|uniref:Uncharacterized protein n=1 Tax=Microthyrium microscopicum TaxID=703497 RepID=A0A6A6UB37_9PEZI|nr:hypothetical protein BT63DRAFT_273163 [Microthyrium microscopicum]
MDRQPDQQRDKKQAFSRGASRQSRHSQSPTCNSDDNRGDGSDSARPRRRRRVVRRHHRHRRRPSTDNASHTEKRDIYDSDTTSVRQGRDARHRIRKDHNDPQHVGVGGGSRLGGAHRSRNSSTHKSSKERSLVPWQTPTPKNSLATKRRDRLFGHFRSPSGKENSSKDATSSQHGPSPGRKKDEWINELKATLLGLAIELVLKEVQRLFGVERTKPKPDDKSGTKQEPTHTKIASEILKKLTHESASDHTERAPNGDTREVGESSTAPSRPHNSTSEHLRNTDISGYIEDYVRREVRRQLNEMGFITHDDDHLHREDAQGRGRSHQYSRRNAVRL